jgi:stalled ribosome rescue protein Dom34
MSYQHAVLWIDHLHARVIDFSVDDRHVTAVEREDGQRQVHRRSGVPGSGKSPVDHVFFDEVVAALGDAQEILVVGPGAAKTELMHDLTARHPAVAKRVVSVETIDHPSDGQLLAYARQYFKRIDALRGN